MWISINEIRKMRLLALSHTHMFRDFPPFNSNLTFIPIWNTRSKGFFFFFSLTQNFTFILIRVSHLYLVRFMHTRIIEIVKSRVRSRTKKNKHTPTLDNDFKAILVFIFCVRYQPTTNYFGDWCTNRIHCTFVQSFSG